MWGARPVEISDEAQAKNIKNFNFILRYIMQY